MCATFTDDDVEKPVVNGAGEEVGVVASVENDIAHVRPSVDAVDSIKSSIGWEAVVDESRPLDTGAVREITDEVVRLEDDLPTADEESADETDQETLKEMDALEEGERDRGLEVDPTELADETGGGGTRTDAAVEPDDDHRSTDAAVDVDSEPRRTDAAVDPGEQPRRTDAEVDPDALDETASTGGPTTEDAGRSDLEDGPEEQRLDSEDDDGDAGEST